MREIRFRAWDKINEEMISWSRLLNGYNLRNVFMGPEMSGLILMQYTGLKDKNGVEIFEGDIVLGGSLKTNSWILNNDKGTTVRYDSGMFKAGGISLCTISRNCEVIGNIYQNSKLSEESK